MKFAFSKIDRSKTAAVKSQLLKDGGHLGLMGLKDRIESLGGKFSVNSELGVGTAIKMSISLVDEI